MARIRNMFDTEEMFALSGVKPKQSWFYAGFYEFVMKWLVDGIDEEPFDESSLHPEDLLAKMYEYSQEFEDDGDVKDFHPVKECLLLHWHGLSEDLDEIIQENKFYGVMGIFLKEELEKHSLAREIYLETGLLKSYDRGFAAALLEIMKLMGETYQELGTVGKLETVYAGQCCPFVSSNIIPDAISASSDAPIDVSESVCDILSAFRVQSDEIARTNGV